MSNCYTCKHRLPVPGSAHSACALIGDEIARMQTALLYAKGYRVTLKDKDTGKKQELLTLDSHGVRSGWCNWPIDFDPVWVKDCLGYTSTEIFKCDTCGQPATGTQWPVYDEQHNLQEGLVQCTSCWAPSDKLFKPTTDE